MFKHTPAKARKKALRQVAKASDLHLADSNPGSEYGNGDETKRELADLHQTNATRLTNPATTPAATGDNCAPSGGQGTPATTTDCSDMNPP